jgi:hypothetical protein
VCVVCIDAYDILLLLIHGRRSSPDRVFHLRTKKNRRM